jgi:hypothetical protein
LSAYADSLGLVFLCAAPVALIGFIVAWTLKQVPLREMETVCVDLGEGFGMPSTESRRPHPRGGGPGTDRAPGAGAARMGRRSS